MISEDVTDSTTCDISKSQHASIDYNKYKLSEKEITHLTQADRCRRSSDDSVVSTTIMDTSIDSNKTEEVVVVIIPVGLKILSLLSMVTAITLITASGILLHKSNQTLIAWLKAAPTTLSILTEVSKVFGGTSAIVDEVNSQEKYLRILILCSGTLIVAGSIQLFCNLWFFFKLNSTCIANCCVKTDQFLFGDCTQNEWFDELLTWNPMDFYNLTSVRLPCDRIWLPDIVLYNSADDYTRGYMPSRAMVNHDGKIFWPPPTKFRSTCPVDVTYFPFDDQICKLKLGSWTYNGFQVDVTNRTTDVDLSNYISNGEWELLGAELQRNVVYYSCCPEPFPDVTITLIIRRKTLFYVFNVIIPCILLSFLTLLVFFLPPDSGEKVALGITVLLAFSVFMLAIAEKMPETSESIPLIGIYLTAVMMITSISVVVTVIVLNLHYLGPRVNQVPSWLRYLLPKDDREFILRQQNEIETNSPSLTNFKNRSNPQVLISHHREESVPGKHSVTTSLDPPPHVHHHKRQEQPPYQSPLSGLEGDEGSSTESVNEDRRGVGLELNHRRHAPNHRPLQLQDASNKSAQTTFPSSISKTSETEAELIQSIRYFIAKQAEVDKQRVLISEWRLAAQVVDRILFWIFFLTTCVSSAVFLVILPFYKRSWNGPLPSDNS